MPQPQGSNETRLPRAIVRRSAAISARYAPPAETENPNPADPNASTNPSATAPATTAEPASNAPAGDPRDTDPAYWKQRFSVTEGILRRERDDRRTESSALHQQMTELTEQVRILKASATAPGAAAKADIAKFFTAAQREQYGEEQCQVMADAAMRAAEDRASELISAAVQPLKDAQARTATDAVADKKRSFYDALAEAYPNFATADVDPTWLAYLAEEDDNGVQRQMILDNHIARLDAKRVAGMFKAWEKSTAPAATPVPPIAPNGTGAAPGVDAPRAPAANAASGSYPSQGEIKEFFKRAALNKVTDKERTEFDARLALRNGPRG